MGTKIIEHLPPLPYTFGEKGKGGGTQNLPKESENSNLKSVLDKDCSLGSVRT